MANTLTLDIYAQTLQPDSFMLALHIGTNDIYLFIPLPVTLTLVGSHKVSGKQNLFTSFSCFFQLNRIKFGEVFKQFKLNNMILILSESS